MALTKSVYDTVLGFTFPNAYIRVDDAVLPSLAGPLKLVVSVYADASAAAANKTPLLGGTQNITLTSEESDAIRVQFLQVLYNMLKLRPEYSGAVDV